MTDTCEQEFAHFVRQARPMLRRIAFRLSQDWYEADDLVQRTLMTLHRRWAVLDRRDRIEPYARQIMRRLVISDRRAMRWSREVLTGLPPDSASASDPYTLVGERLALMDALARLGPRQRATLFLRFWEDRSVEDTARVMGNESSTVRSQTVRALNALRSALDT
ncbi:sigma-70 family RNA polymerase sigma factor [Thermostaphylospora chromogena]|uniref:RNA polymerase sigma-70 factor, sigma-E family n=1 Tax=Thermostaphylospora chromogena TaxID=35622 RepID=A0A1H0ZS58_9ACTN|nr:sigma-70 family RNA polymerase sigma factor [Thermostaphylospora chromogena]SDQ30270.1 RNA polymerase sigma-70 factor, sigma-E family [Thermostaphylospora chromogena]